MVNIADVNNPKEVAFIGAKEGSYPGEGIQAVHLDTPAFNGDILVSNNATCNEKTGFGGMNIYDVTNPLAEGIGDFTVNGQGKKAANEIHSVFAWDAGNKALAGRESVSLKGGGASAPPPFSRGDKEPETFMPRPGKCQRHDAGRHRVSPGGSGFPLPRE